MLCFRQQAASAAECSYATLYSCTSPLNADAPSQSVCDAATATTAAATAERSESSDAANAWQTHRADSEWRLGGVQRAQPSCTAAAALIAFYGCSTTGILQQQQQQQQSIPALTAHPDTTATATATPTSPATVFPPALRSSCP